MFFAKIIDPFVEGFFRFFEVIKSLKSEEIYHGKQSIFNNYLTFLKKSKKS